MNLHIFYIDGNVAIFCKSDKMADFGSAFYWEWELLLGVVKGHVK